MKRCCYCCPDLRSRTHSRDRFTLCHATAASAASSATQVSASTRSRALKKKTSSDRQRSWKRTVVSAGDLRNLAQSLRNQSDSIGLLPIVNDQ